MASRAKKAVRGPGYDGGRHVGMREAPDPFDPAGTIMVPVNLRHDPVARMAARGKLGKAQVAAAQRFGALLEAAGNAGAPACDFTVEPVDGGGSAPDLHGRKLEAARQLAALHRLLGWEGYRVCRAVIGEGLNLNAICVSCFGGDKDRLKWLVMSFADNLEKMAEHFGLVQSARAARRRAAMVSTDNWALEFEDRHGRGITTYRIVHK